MPTAPHRGRGEGSVRQLKPDLWRAEIMVGWKLRASDGKRVRDRLYAYGATRPKARANLQQKRNARGTGPRAGPSRVTLAEHLATWLQDVVLPARGPSTYRTYEALLRVHVRPALGALRLQEVTAAALQAVYAELVASQALQPSSVRLLRGVMGAALEQARRWKLRPDNPNRETAPPVLPGREITPLDEAQAAHLLATAHRLHDPYAALWALLLDTGMRHGEARALSRRHVDMRAGTVRVDGTVRRHRGGALSIGPPKTRRSRRTIPLSPGCQVVLANYLRGLPPDRDLLFAASTGNPLNGSALGRPFKRLLAAAGLPRTVRVHDLRHTNATLLLKAGEDPDTVSRRLGHANAYITCTVYSHALPHAEQRAAQRIGRLLFPLAEAVS